ncbi:MAG: dGTPase [Kiritimatiellia bacterium]
MIQSRTEREKLEEAWLSPFAAKSSQSRGRLYPESRHSRRVDFQRDRDRIVNCKSFRRLEYKTQVFVNGTADHYRTRLTHTIEMASVGRTLSRALRANEDLTACICLAHDIGHSPFGHCGERALNELMADHGGFDHNEQSLRWVELLEADYPGHEGCNLTWEVRAGLRKHESRDEGKLLDGFPIGPYQYAEGQIADVADDITYQAHDVADGLDAGLIHEEELEQLELWCFARDRVLKEYPNCPADRLAPTVIRCLFTVQIEDVLQIVRQRTEEWDPQTPEEVMNAPGRLVDFSPAMRTMLKPFRAYLFDHMYYHPDVKFANDEAVEMMKGLFLHYLDHPEDLGSKAQARLPSEGLERTVCDYVAGCTDRYAIEEFKRFL